MGSGKGGRVVPGGRVAGGRVIDGRVAVGRVAGGRVVGGRVVLGDDGMSTVEYALGTIAAAALAMLLYSLVSGDWALGLLRGLLERAFTVGG